MRKLKINAKQRLKSRNDKVKSQKNSARGWIESTRVMNNGLIMLCFGSVKYKAMKGSIKIIILGFGWTQFKHAQLCHGVKY